MRDADQRARSDAAFDLGFAQAKLREYIVIVLALECGDAEWRELVAGETPRPAWEPISATVPVRHFLHRAPAFPPIRFRREL